RFFVFLGRCAVGLWRASETPRTHFASGASRLGRDSLRAFALIFTPTTRWPTNAPPNFLAPSLVFFFLWTRPFALAAVVYSILANETQKNGDGGVARRQAAAARNWIFIELLFVAAKALVEAFGLSLPLLKKLFF
ncbi:MAG: CD225/dispanin family protein, partial [Thermoguttaceae bacterium]|nr:CD225/dispanin family protein [Thermoguttaceae bacterium]